MTAAYIHPPTGDREFLRSIRAELLNTSKDIIRTAAFLPLSVIRFRLGVSRADAFTIRQECRRWIVDQWNFQDEGGAGQEWNKGSECDSLTCAPE